MVPKQTPTSAAWWGLFSECIYRAREVAACPWCPDRRGILQGLGRSPRWLSALGVTTCRRIERFLL
jgi:hypothetical protein